MRAYLDAMDAAQYAAPEPTRPVPLVLAALGPKMLELAAQRADGAHPYFVPVEHTPLARRHLGPDPCLAVEKAAVLTTDREPGLDIARASPITTWCCPTTPTTCAAGLGGRGHRRTTAATG